MLRLLTGGAGLPLLVLVPQADGAGLHRAVGVVEDEGELEERGAVGASAGLLVGGGAHELADHRDVRVRGVVGELVQALGELVVVGVHPRLGCFGRHELEPKGSHAAPARHLDGLELAAGDPQRRVWLLTRLGHDVAQREVEVLAVVLPALLPEHGHEGAHGVLPHGTLLAELAVERVQLGDAGTLAHAELDPPVADEVQGADALGHPGRVVGGQLHDAVPEADVLRALAGGGQEHLGRRGVAVLLEEVVLHLPRVVVAELVGRLDLGERVVEQLVLVVGCPGLGQLQLVEDAELHWRTPEERAGTHR